MRSRKAWNLKAGMKKKGITFLIALCLVLSACASPIEVAQKTAQAQRTPTVTPDLSAPAMTPQPGGLPTQSPGQSANGEPACSLQSRQEGVTAALWDDKRQQYQLQQLDPENGLPLCDTKTFPLGPYVNQAVSPDGRTLASFVYRDEYYQAGILSLFDINSWQVFTTTVKVDAEINRIIFNNAGDLMAFALQPKPGEGSSPRCPLYLFDLKTRQVIDSTVLDFIPRFMHFMDNGKWLAIYGSTAGGETVQQPLVFALLLWVKPLALAWKQELNILDGSMLIGTNDQEQTLATWSPGLAFLAAQETLYIVSANEEKYTIVDYASRSVETKDIHLTPLSWFDRLLAQTAGIAQATAMGAMQKQAVLSADGELLYITGQTTGASIGPSQPDQATGLLGLQVIDLKTSSQTDHLDTRAINIQVSPNGKYLFLTSWDSGNPSTDVIRADTREVVAHLPGQSLLATRTFAGQVVLLSLQERLTESQVSLLDPQTFNALYTWSASGKPLWLTYGLGR
jgi:hypothetical protein